MTEQDTKFKLGRGLDLGTNAICMSVLDEQDHIHNSWIRDAFLTLKPQNKIIRSAMLKSFQKNDYKYMEKEDELILIGEDALMCAAERMMTTERPMSRGVVSPKSAKNLPIFKVLIASILGEPTEPGEVIYYSIPAAPIDEQFDSEYHSAVIERILSDLGYEAHSMNEAEAIVYSQLDEENYTGVTLSFGAGMVNLCISNAAQPLARFSTSKSGDYIDKATALALGYDEYSGNKNDITPSIVQLTKETCGLDLLNPDPEDRIQIGLVSYYKSLINYSIDNIIYQIGKLETTPRFNEPITFVVSGGTSKVKNFVTVFEKVLRAKESELPFKIEKVKHAKDPLYAVANGCLFAAQLHYEEEGE